MQNRDYFTKPHQSGGRSAHGYGNTNLTTEPDTRGLLNLCIACSVVVIGGLMIWVLM